MGHYYYIQGSEEEKKREEERRGTMQAPEETYARVKVGFYIDARVMAKLRGLIQQKYNRYEKGLLSYEAEQAFRHWLSLHTNAQNTLDAKPPNPTPRAAIVYMQVKDYLLRTHYDSLVVAQQIPRRHLEEAIAAVRGSDKRTVAAWLRTFDRLHLAKPKSSASWELL